MSSSSRFDRHFWLITLSALLVGFLTFALGLWQLDRASQKEQWSREWQNIQPIKLSGEWMPEQTLYVDNRQMNAKQGFFVVTPLLTSPTEYVLALRGWIPRHFMDRKKLALVDTPAGLVTIEARQVSDPVQPAVFAAAATNEYPIVPWVDVTAIGKALPDKAYKGMVQQVGNASEGLLRNWYQPASGVEKHYGYAFQWFALCAAVLGLYVWFQWLKPKATK